MVTTSSTTGRFVDEFRSHLELRGLRLDAQLEECPMFGDLEWSPKEADVDSVVARTQRDPAFTLVSGTRWIALARINAELRYHAGPIPVGGDACLSADPHRRTAIDLEADCRELGVLPDVESCVAFMAAFFDGSPLEDIPIARAVRGSHTTTASHTTSSRPR